VLFGARRRGAYLRFEVWDTGVGIADDHREEIFQEFYQIGSPERDRSRGQGLGLGLAVVHRLSVLLGHRVEVRSVPGKGSLFAVEVPMTQEPEDDEIEVYSAAREPNSDMAGAVVVVIEDEAEVLAGTRMNLEDWGCRVIAADTIDAALAKIAESDRQPDAILMDYHLHGEEIGTMAIERIRRFVGTPIPAIIVTGDTAPWRIREAAENGYALVHKPVRPEKLRALLQAGLSGARQRARAEVV
jgi:CheY-like chemotaxis protein